VDVCLSSLKQHRCIAIHAEETSSSGGVRGVSVVVGIGGFVVRVAA